MKKNFIIALTLCFGFTITFNSYPQSEKTVPFDVVLVLDNSGSMKNNDPDFLIEDVVLKFIKGLPASSRIGIIVFSDNAELILRLTDLPQIQAKINIDSLMEKISYSGKYTNIPSAVERAVYELKQNSRKNAGKFIIIITDGIVDTGDPLVNRERQKWLEEELAIESRDASIKIFGIAFTEKADFMLLQTLSRKTDGEYYRALKSEDIGLTLVRIKEALSKKNEIESRPDTIKIVEHNNTMGLASEYYYFGSILVVLLFAGGFYFYYRSRQGNLSGGKTLAQIPETYLLDIECVTGKASYKIDKRIFKIGRQQSCDLSIRGEDKYISALHATIEFKDDSFILSDQKSINHTYINGRKLEENEKVQLKSGDEITFFKYRFKYIRTDEGEFGETILFNSN